MDIKATSVSSIQDPNLFKSNWRNLLTSPKLEPELLESLVNEVDSSPFNAVSWFLSALVKDEFLIYCSSHLLSKINNGLFVLIRSTANTSSKIFN